MLSIQSLYFTLFGWALLRLAANFYRRMPRDTTNWLIAINGGCCPEATSKGILNNKPDASKDSQKWAVEKGDRPEKVAFYNVAEKKYLRTNNGNAATRVELGEKQWWMLERDGDAGTYWYLARNTIARYWH